MTILVEIGRNIDRLSDIDSTTMFLVTYGILLSYTTKGIAKVLRSLINIFTDFKTI